MSCIIAFFLQQVTAEYLNNYFTTLNHFINVHVYLTLANMVIIAGSIK